MSGAPTLSQPVRDGIMLGFDALSVVLKVATPKIRRRAIKALRVELRTRRPDGFAAPNVAHIRGDHPRLRDLREADRATVTMYETALVLAKQIDRELTRSGK